MRRRLTVAMVVMVLVTLALSGVVSLFLAQRTTVNQTQRELVQEASGLAASVQRQANGTSDPAVTLRNLLVALKTTLRLDGDTVLAVRANGQLIGLAPVSTDPQLPSGLTPSLLRPADLY